MDSLIDDPFAGPARRKPTTYTEKDLWRDIRKHLTPPEHEWERVENAVSQGMSDVVGIKNCVVAWTELKVFKFNKLCFQPSQRPWILRWSRAGARVFIVARNLEQLVIFPGRQIEALYDARVAYTKGHPNGTADAEAIKRLACFTTHKPFDWPGLSRVLFGGRIVTT
jgi:hypothetical protein